MNPIKKRIWKIAQYSLNKLGIHALLEKKGYHYVQWEPGYHYVPDYYGRSAHKQIDIRSIDAFTYLADKVIKAEKTLHYYDRLYVIYQALSHISRIPKPDLLNPTNLAEVGVYKGGTSYFIASAAEALGIDSYCMHCFDTFQGHLDEDIRADVDDNTFHKEKLFGDTLFETVSNYLSDFKATRLHKGRFQDTCAQINSEKFYFVHIDVDLYSPIIFSLNFFKDRLIAGGIIVVDDYGFTTCPGAKQAVDEFIQDSGQSFFPLYLLTGQCLLVKYHQ